MQGLCCAVRGLANVVQATRSISLDGTIKASNLTVLAWSLQTYVLVKHFYAKKGSAEGKYQVDYKTKMDFLRGFCLNLTAYPNYHV
jgi:hypothetical protein